MGIGLSHERISVHRTKGRIIDKNGDEWILQGVGEVYEMKKVAGMATEQQSKIVLIGEGLQRKSIEKSLAYTLALDTQHSK
jgi:G3E family GTPase